MDIELGRSTPVNTAASSARVQAPASEGKQFALLLARTMLSVPSAASAGEPAESSSQLGGSPSVADSSSGFATGSDAAQQIRELLRGYGTPGGPLEPTGYSIANAVKASAPPPSTTSAEVPTAYAGLIQGAARRYQVDPALIAAVIQTESNFNPKAESSAGAKGLMQLMDATARGLGVADSFDPSQNVEGGAKLLRQLLDRYRGNLEQVLAAYNAGPGAVDKYGGVPPFAETQRYVPKVLASVQRFRLAAGPSAAVH